MNSVSVLFNLYEFRIVRFFLGPKNHTKRTDPCTISERILTHFIGEGAVQVHSIGKVVHHLNFVVALQDLLEAYSLAGNLSALLPHSHTEMILRETYFTYHSPRHFLNFFSNHGGEIANSKKSLCETCHSIQINTLGVQLAKSLTEDQRDNTVA